MPLAASIAVGTLAAITPTALADEYEFRVIARTGTVVPEVGGTFVSFRVPRLNAGGQVAFGAVRTADVGQSGVWVTPADDPTTLQTVLLSGTQAPGLPGGVVFGSLTPSTHEPELNDAGTVAIAAPLQGLGSPSANGLFRFIDGELSKVAATGDPVPSVGAGVFFRRLGSSVSINDNDLMAFGSLLEGPGVSTGTNTAIHMHWFGGLNLVRREGGVAPPAAFGWTWGNNAAGEGASELLPLVQIADDGRLGFDSELFTSLGSTTSRWTGWPGALEHGMLGGSLSPTFHPFLNERENFGAFGTMLTEDGFVFVHGIDVDGQERQGIWRRTAGAVETVAHEGGDGPLGPYQNIWPFDVIASWDGTVAFPATFDAPDPTRVIVVRRPGQDAVVVLRQGDQAPGYPEGVQFGPGLQAAAIDDLGRLYVRGYVDQPGPPRGGYWRIDPSGTITPVLLEGQWLALDDGIEREVVLINLRRGAGLGTGSRHGVNDAGQVALQVFFADATEAIVVAEPVTCCADIDDDGQVGLGDLLQVLAGWMGSGAADIAPPPGDGVVDFADLLAVLGAWGPCP